MSENESSTPVATPHRPQRRGGGLVFLLLLVLIAAVAGGGWYGWRLANRLLTSQSDLQSRVDQLQQQLTQARQKHGERLAKLSNRLDQVEAQQAANQRTLQQMRAGGQKDWLLNEAEALARLAQQRLLLTSDVAAAQRLLEASDKVLSRVDDPDALKARKAVAADIEKLRGARQVDVTALVLRLGALESQVSDITVPGAKPPAPEKTAGQQPAVSGWWGSLLGKLPVTVRRHDGSMPLPLDRQQASLVRLNLGNSLQQAQLALMQGRPKTFHNALGTARATLHSWFSDDDPKVRQLRSSLNDLDKAPVEQALPDIGQGLAAIRALIGKESGQ